MFSVSSDSSVRPGTRVVRRTCLCAVLIAVSVLLCRLVGFPPTGMWRVDLGFLPIVVIAMLYGPVYSGIAYGISDLVGAAIFTGVNPFITLCKVLSGALMGLFLYLRKRKEQSDAGEAVQSKSVAVRFDKNGALVSGDGERQRPFLPVWRILLCFFFVSLFADFAAMVPIFHLSFGYGLGEALIYRGANAAVNFVLRIVIIILLSPHLTRLLSRLKGSI